MRLHCGKKTRWLLLGSALVVILWCCRGPILAGAARPLVADDPPEDVDCVWILRGVDRAYDAAARLHREKPSRRIVLVDPLPSRLVRLGILPSDEEIARRELAARGVPQESVVVIGRGSRGAWQEARQLADWLERQRGARVLALVNRFHSARQRSILDAVLGGDDAQRVGIIALPDRRYDESNWWQSRTGVKGFMFAWLRRAYSSWVGEAEEPPAPLELEDFERLVAENSAEVLP